MSGIQEVYETEYGIRIVTKGIIDENVLISMGKEVSRVLAKLKKGFGVLHDMRGMLTLSPETREVMKQYMEVSKQSGMGRSAQILDDAIIALQFTRLAREVGISDTMRQIDASKVPDCEGAATDWIVKGIDPNA